MRGKNQLTLTGVGMSSHRREHCANDGQVSWPSPTPTHCPQSSPTLSAVSALWPHTAPLLRTPGLTCKNPVYTWLLLLFHKGPVLDPIGPWRAMWHPPTPEPLLELLYLTFKEVQEMPDHSKLSSLLFCLDPGKESSYPCSCNLIFFPPNTVDHLLIERLRQALCCEQVSKFHDSGPIARAKTMSLLPRFSLCEMFPDNISFWRS